MTTANGVSALPVVLPLNKLREPFPPATVGKLPRITCKDCSKRNCQKHATSKCNECGGYLSNQHIHLDYVGHAEVTDRLLSVDPTWNWEPVARDDRGLPLIVKGADGKLLLWINLTVCGVTRIGVGSVDAGSFDADKQLIGDALRNAAMRFGVALDLWSKNELESALEGEVAAGVPTAPAVEAGFERGPVTDAAVTSPAPPTRRRPPPLADPDTGEVIAAQSTETPAPFNSSNEKFVDWKDADALREQALADGITAPQLAKLIEENAPQSKTNVMRRVLKAEWDAVESAVENYYAKAGKG